MTAPFVSDQELARAAREARAWRIEQAQAQDPRRLVLDLRAWLRHATGGKRGRAPPADWEARIDDWLESWPL